MFGSRALGHLHIFSLYMENLCLAHCTTLNSYVFLSGPRKYQAAATYLIS